MIGVILVLVVIGLILYLVETYIPMADPIKMVIRVVVAIFLIFWLMQVFGVLDVPVPRLR